MKYTVSTPADFNAKAALLKPGDELACGEGVFSFTQQPWVIANGSQAAPIRVTGVPGKTIFSPTSNYQINPDSPRDCGMYIHGDWLIISGIRVTGFTQRTTMVWNGILAMDCNYCIFDRLEVDNNGAGMYIQGASTGNQVINSDFHHNSDPMTGGGNADGLDVAYVKAGTSNTVKGCRAWMNSDDGFDSFENLGFISWDSCWSWDNGKFNTGPNSNGVGFKLGTIGSGNAGKLLRRITNCIAYRNRLSGFHQEEGEAIMELNNNAAYQNSEHGFLLNWKGIPHKLANNWTFGNSENQAVINDQAAVVNCVTGPGYAGNTQTSNWPQKVSNQDFLSVDGSQLAGARKADGSLPSLTFLALAPISDIQGIGPIYAAGTPPPVTIPPTANAGLDINVVLPVDFIKIIGSGTGTGLTYKWTAEDGTVLSTGALLQLDEVDTAGTYKFTLTVMDTNGLTATDEVVVTVIAKPTVPTATLKGTVYYYTDNSTTVNKQNLSKKLFVTIKVFSDGTVQKI